MQASSPNATVFSLAVVALPRLCSWLFFLCCLNFALPATAAEKTFPLQFTTIRLGENAPGSAQASAQDQASPLPDKAEAPVVLVVGGIQGDEPGGFSAATLLTTNYTIRKGVLWVVPNLNFPSIIKRSRGLYGDMNFFFITQKNGHLCQNKQLVQKITS